MTHDTLISPARPTLTVRLGEQPHTVPAGSTLADLVAALGHAPNAVGTAVNGQFVPRALRGRALQANDLVVLFQAIVGG